MNKYVFLTPSLSNMGGAQMYIRNKLLYLQANGWNTLVISGQGKNVIIPELQIFDCYIPEIAYYQYQYPIRKQKKIIEEIIRTVNAGRDDKVVFESTTLMVSTWGESVAKQVGAKHFVYLLREHNCIRNKGLLDFMKFKHKRRELAGITNMSLYEMFKPFYIIQQNESYRLNAYCINVEADVDCPYLHQIDKSHYDFIVGGFSRLDKPFVLSAVNDFFQYAKNNSNYKFLLLWIGDSPSDCSTKAIISEKIKLLYNVELLITGYLYPVPTRLLELCDVFISSAGSSWVCMRSGVPTITYDSNDMRPIGVLGVTTQNVLFRDENEPILSFDQLMNDILVEKKIGRIPTQYSKELPDFNEHLAFLEQSASEIDYYDIGSIKVKTLKGKFVKLLGPQNYQTFCLLMKKRSETNK